jgi:hypothetical protein
LVCLPADLKSQVGLLCHAAFRNLSGLFAHINLTGHGGRDERLLLGNLFAK